MRRRVLVIGIGAGDPDYVTVQAVKAMNRVSVFLVPDKGAEKSGLARLRREICARHIAGEGHRFVSFEVPARERDATNYEAAVEAWRSAVRAVYERLLREEAAEGEVAGVLVWGDPSLYDGTLSILDGIRMSGEIDLEIEVVPGISSVQALAARHGTTLNRIGDSITITTGRRLEQGFPDEADSVVVMLDARSAYQGLDGDIDIFWGAYVGTGDEILVAGKLRDVRDEIARVRAAAKEKHGWVMDTYLLARDRRRGGA